MPRMLTFMLLLIAPGPTLLADATIPTEDLPASQDSPLLGRYQRSVIISYDHRGFDEFTFPLSMLEEVEGKRDTHNNRFFAPADKMTVEGSSTRLVYLMPEPVSPLEVLRSYQEEIHNKGGEIRYECKEEECGGDPSRGSDGGGGLMSLSMFLRPNEHIKDPVFSNGNCAQATGISGQRYSVGVIDDPEAYISILSYTVDAGHYCRAIDGRTVAVVDITQPKEREQKMVVVKAEEMATKIADRGSIALYGIHFDFNKAEIQIESRPALEQIAKLLREEPSLELLVVGHTDNVGSFGFNQDLSQRRAAAVVDALVSWYGIARDRLTSVGVSYASPVASNGTEAGRAKNRRVELVEN